MSYSVMKLNKRADTGDIYLYVLLSPIHIKVLIQIFLLTLPVGYTMLSIQLDLCLFKTQINWPKWFFKNFSDNLYEFQKNLKRS